MENAIVGVVTTLITQFLKKAPLVPVNAGQKAKLRSVALVVSGVVTLALAWIDGSIATQATSSIVSNILVNALVAFGVYNVTT